MARRIWCGDFDILMAYQSTASVLAGCVGFIRGCGLRVVHQTSTPGEVPWPVRALDKLAGSAGLYSANIANSVATRSEFDGYPARYRGSMMLIEHGLDAPAPQRSRAATRGGFGLPQDAPLLLNVGRLMPQKNQDVLVRALAGLPRAHLALAGGGLQQERYRALAAQLGVADRLHCLGALPAADIADLYRASDLFVFPSTWETFGLAAVEAAMIGLPMVVADLPVLREVLQTDVAAPVRFVAPHDVEGWTAAVRAWLDAPPPRHDVESYAQAIRRKYARQRMIASYLDLMTKRSGARAAGLETPACA